MPDLIQQAAAAVAADERAVHQSRAEDRDTYIMILRRRRHPFPDDGAKLARLMALLKKDAAAVRHDIEAMEMLDAAQEDVEALADEADGLDPAQDQRQRLASLDRELAIKIDAMLDGKRQLLADIEKRDALDAQLERAVQRRNRARRDLNQRLPY